MISCLLVSSEVGKVLFEDFRTKKTCKVACFVLEEALDKRVLKEKKFVRVLLIDQKN